MVMRRAITSPRKTRRVPKLSERNILAAAAYGVHDFISQHGVDPQQVLSDAGVEGRLLENPKVALDLGSYVDMMELAAARTGNDNFGLRFGLQFKPERLGLIGGIAVASPSLGGAVANLAELFPYHQQATETRLVRDDQFLRLEYRILDGRIVERRQDAELTLGMFVNVFRHCLGSHWAPCEVHCEHLKPEGWREHERAFDAPVHFGQRTNAIIFRDWDLSRRMPQGDLHRLGQLRNELIGVAGGTGAVSFLDKLKGEIRSRLPAEAMSITAVADAMGLPRWTFQRRLAEYGLNFSDLVDLVRRELAAIYIRQHHVAVTDIAFALGYSELSALSRAFRRWYGASPQQLRARCPSRIP
jgi:AraC-like DNA-binding protein